MSEFHEQIVEKIVSVWRDADFQSNPESYVTQWNKDRGGLEALTPPGKIRRWHFTR